MVGVRVIYKKDKIRVSGGSGGWWGRGGGENGWWGGRYVGEAVVT